MKVTDISNKSNTLAIHLNIGIEQDSNVQCAA